MEDSDTHQNLTYAVSGLAGAHVVASGISLIKHNRDRLYEKPFYQWLSVVVCIAIIGVTSAAIQHNPEDTDKSKRNRKLHISVIAFTALLLIITAYVAFSNVKKDITVVFGDFSPVLVCVPVILILACVVYAKGSEDDENQKGAM